MLQNLPKDGFIALQNLSQNKDFIIQKSDEENCGNSWHTDQNKFHQVSLKDDTLLNSAFNKKLHSKESHKNDEPNSDRNRSKEIVKTCKYHTKCSFVTNFMCLNTPTYKVAKF